MGFEGSLLWRDLSFLAVLSPWPMDLIELLRSDWALPTTAFSSSAG